MDNWNDRHNMIEEYVLPETRHPRSLAIMGSLRHQVWEPWNKNKDDSGEFLQKIKKIAQIWIILTGEQQVRAVKEANWWYI